MSFAAHVAALDQSARKHLGGEAVVYQPAVGEAVEVTGIFDRPYQILDQAEVGIEDRSAQVWLVLDDLPTDPREDDPQITIGGETYRVRERPGDSIDGSILLRLAIAEGA